MKHRHLTDAQAAAIPLAGLTAWRSAFTRGSLQKGEHMLVAALAAAWRLLNASLGLPRGLMCT